MIRNLRLAKIFWSVTTTVALAAALGGVVWKDIYLNLFAKEYLPGASPQDLLTIFICILSYLIIATTRERDIRKQVVILGLVGSFYTENGI